MRDPSPSIRSEGEASIAANQVIGSVLSTGAGAINLVVNADREGAAGLVPAFEAAFERQRAESVPALKRLFPVYRARARPDHVDREAEARDLLAAGAVTVLSGPRGIGKTYVAWHALAGHAPELPDGTVRLRASAPDLDDLEYALYSVFWEGGPPGRPPQTVIERDLAPLRAVIVLDDFPATAERVAIELANALPECCLAFATRSPIMPGAARQLELRGLADADALNLFERILGRSLHNDERDDAARLCEALSGYPGAIAEAASEARMHGLTVVAADVARPDAFARLAARRAAELTPDEQAVLPIVAAFEDTPLGERHVAAITGRVDAATVLLEAERRGLTEAHSPRYTLAGSLATHPPASWDVNTLEAARDRIVAHYVAWVQRSPSLGDLAEEHQGLQRAMRHALQQGRRREAIILGRALSDALLVSRRLGAWGAAVTAVHHAAEALDDTSTMAWALHQRGVREWWLRDPQAGIAYLEEALRLRRDVVRDDAAAARTQRTLDAIRPPAPVPWWRRWHSLPLVVILLLVLGAATAGAMRLLDEDEATTRVLTVEVRGEGTVVASYDEGERRCHTQCHVTVADGSDVRVRPDADGFEEWSGDCDGADECVVTMDGDREVTARFAKDGTPTPTPTPTATPTPTPAGSHTLTVRPGGDGTGTITSDPEGIDCGETCEHAFDDGTAVTVEANADEGSEFTGWGLPACADDALTCRLELTSDLRLAPSFARAKVPVLTVNLTLEQGSYPNGAESSVQVVAGGRSDACTVTATTEQLDAADVTQTCSYEAPQGTSLEVTKPSSSNRASCNGADARLPCAFDMPAAGASVDVRFDAPPG